MYLPTVSDKAALSEEGVALVNLAAIRSGHYYTWLQRDEEMDMITNLLSPWCVIYLFVLTSHSPYFLYKASFSDSTSK